MEVRQEAASQVSMSDQFEAREGLPGRSIDRILDLGSRILRAGASAQLFSLLLPNATEGGKLREYVGMLVDAHAVQRGFASRSVATLGFGHLGRCAAGVHRHR